MQPHGKVTYTLEEYLELDHNSEEKIEFWDGYTFTLAGATQKHDKIQFNCALALGTKLRGKPCRVFLSDMRVEVPDYPPCVDNQYSKIWENRNCLQIQP